VPRAKEIASRGWQQGSIITDQQLLSRARRADGQSFSLSDAKVGIVVTQDCDLIHGSFEAEPFAEILIATDLRTAGKVSDQFAGGRHPRRLHFRDRNGNLYEASSKDRAFLDRSLFTSNNPSGERQLPDVEIALIRSWMRKRYDRPAFPDAFDERLRDRREQIRLVVTQYAKDISAISITLDTKKELSDKDAYHVRRLVIVFDSKRTDVDRADKAAAELAAAVTCEGIEVDDYAAVPKTKFTLAAAEEGDVWDFDYLSYSDEQVTSE